jgi:polyisoprenyl-phosphate glycosyltransferase
VPELSVVVPVFNCEGCLEELHRRLTATLERMAITYELVLVEDGGADESWTLIHRLAASDHHVRGVRLSRNFGQHAAITAGVARTCGNWVVVMDCDLQDPPEEIERLYETAQDGFDIVFARRRSRHLSPFRRLANWAYFTSLRLFSGADIGGEYGSFSIISRKVAGAFLRLREGDRHYIFILHWLGFRSAAIEYDVAERAAGRSAYGFRRLVAHAADGIFFQTTALLRWVVYVGFGVAAIGAGAAVFLVVQRLTGEAYPGWTSLFVLTLVVGGIIIVSTGVTGLYIGKVFDEVRARPLFVIDEEVGAEVPEAATALVDA